MSKELALAEFNDKNSRIFNNEYDKKAYDMYNDIHKHWGYEKLKNEMSYFYPLLNFINIESFQNRCQTIFPEIEREYKTASTNKFNKILDNQNSNLIALKSNKPPNCSQILKRKGWWSDSENSDLILILVEGLSSGKLITPNHKIKKLLAELDLIV